MRCHVLVTIRPEESPSKAIMLGHNNNKLLTQKQTQLQLSRKQMYWKYCFLLSPLFEIGGIFSSPSQSCMDEEKDGDEQSSEMKMGEAIDFDNMGDAINVSQSQSQGRGEGEHKGMEEKESDSGKNKAAKRLKFASTIRVCLIPTRAETHVIAQDLYFTQQDFVEMKRDAIIELRDLLQNSNISSKQALHMLYQPM